jgi:hypothetical protein
MDQKIFMEKWQRVTERSCRVDSFFGRKDEQINLIYFDVVSENPDSIHQVIYDRKLWNMICDCQDFKRRGPCCIHMMTAALFYVRCNWQFNQFSFQNDLEPTQEKLDEGIPSKILKFSNLLWALGYGEEPAITAEEKDALRIDPPDPTNHQNANGNEVVPSQPEEPAEPPEPTETLSEIIDEIGDELGEEVDVTLVVKRTLALPRGGWLHLGAEELKFHLLVTSLPHLRRIEKALLAELAELSSSPEVAQLMGRPAQAARPRAQARTPPPVQREVAPPQEESDGAEEGQAGQEYNGEEENVDKYWG